jgi:SpoIID/LytB domain protein
MLVAASAAASVVAAALAGPAPPAGAYPYASVSLVGHGWGHGIGMGQWGALGYAIGQDNGLGPQTYSWILAHYYAPATLLSPGSAADSQNVRVAMLENNDHFLIATTASATPNVTVPGSGPAGAVMFQPAGSAGSFRVFTATGCAGPTWTEQPGTTTSPVTQAADGGQIELCLVGGQPLLAVRGQLRAVVNSAGANRTVNDVPLGQYLNGVVPSESSAGWGSLGDPGPQGQRWGFQALEAQAVAARAYVLSHPGGYGGYADTCDTTACQRYPGTLNENPLSTAAVAATAGQVMVMPGGAVATTQYSASTGGYTASAAEGSPFVPVADDGDAVCVPGGGFACNPNHSWTTSIAVSDLAATFPQIGTLQSIAVTGRNGLGDLGGRATRVTVVGTSGTVTLSGAQFAADFSLRSDWFAIVGQPSGGVGGFWLSAADGGIFAFGNAPFLGSMGGHPLNLPVVGMAATADHAGYFEVAADGGIFAFGDAGFAGSMGGRPLNRPMVGMAVDPATGGYWEVASDGGIFAFGAPFLGSMGASRLNRPVVGMAVTPDGGGYWLVASDGGIFAFGAPFLGSMGASRLNRPVVGMAVTPDGGGYWLVAADGGIFAFGDARFAGSTGSLTLARPVVGMAATADGGGYWLVASDGGIFAFADAVFAGSAAGTPAGNGAVAVVGTRTDQGYFLVNGGGVVDSFGDAPMFGDLTTVLGSYGGQVVGAASTPG